jgi:ABC-2 type transport system permease protein
MVVRHHGSTHHRCAEDAFMTLLQAEWMRLARNRVSVGAMLVVLALLLVSSIDSGLRAAERRDEVARAEQQWRETLQQMRSDTRVNAGEESAAAASAAFEFGRTESPSTPRPAAGGLALAPRQFAAVPPDARVTLESRYVDARRTEVIRNPLLTTIGMPDFSVMVSLLLPLLIIGLCYGLVQDAREQGVWRMVLAQTSRPWRALFLALWLRWFAAVAIVVSSSAVALLLDGAADRLTWTSWTLGVGAAALWWTALAGLFNLLRISSAATALSLLAVWLVTSFAAPPLLAAWAARLQPAASVLTTVHAVREIQQTAESQDPELLERWYTENPEYAPKTIRAHAFPVTFVPRYLEQDRHIVPLMLEVDERRSRRAAHVANLSWLAPGAALVLLADELAGQSAHQQTSYMRAVVRFEQSWRAVLVPGVMSYSGLDERDLDALSELRFELHPSIEARAILSPLGLSAAVLMLVLFALRRRSAAGD